nr:hypothetical protein [Tanacetum cinerariifolium]
MQEYYAGQGSGHDYYAGQGSGGNQEFHTGQDYSMGHGLAGGSALVEDDSLVKNVVAPTKGKKVIEYFEKETRSNLGYDSILSKWKNRVLPKIGAFCAIFDNVQRRNESGSCDLTVYQKACVKYATEYDHDFSFEPCWQILKNHPSWKQVEMPTFYSKQNPGSKNVKTSETTLDSAQGGLNLNEDATGFEEVIREVRPMGWDRARAKKSSTSSRYEASFVVGGGIVDMVADKQKSFKAVGWGKMKEQQQSYIELKNRELDIHEKANREAAELKRQELELTR